MSKLKQPIISLGARGTISDAITFQRAHHTDIVREKPIPAYRNTLPQQYQRWLYQDYAYLWRQQSEAIKQTYRTRASRYHLTGYSLWMREHLRDLTNIAGLWHLDEKAGAVAHDSGPYQTHGIIIGATPADGIINGGYYFTLNDYINITTPQLDFTSEDFSIEARIFLDDLTQNRYIFQRGRLNIDGWEWIVYAWGGQVFRTNQLGSFQQSTSPAGDIATGAWYTVGVRRSGTSVRLFTEGVDVTAVAAVHQDPVSTTRVAKIGIAFNSISNPWDGRLDHVVAHERALDPADFLRHSERRYP